jgi:hypothetical protein
MWGGDPIAIVTAEACRLPTRLCCIDERVSANSDVRSAAGVCGPAAR